MDDAVRLVALSGVPAYLAAPYGARGAVGEEARRHLAALAVIDRAPNLEALRVAM
jgi:hypothetical protein